MRMLARDGAFRRKPRVGATDDPEALRLLRIVEGMDRMWERFITAGAARTFGVSYATYCEWKRRQRGGGEGAGSPQRRALPCSFCEGRVASEPCDKHGGAQFDHMTLHIDGKTFKEFRAVCPRTPGRTSPGRSRARP